MFTLFAKEAEIVPLFVYTKPATAPCPEMLKVFNTSVLVWFRETITLTNSVPPTREFVMLPVFEFVITKPAIVLEMFWEIFVSVVPEEYTTSKPKLVCGEFGKFKLNLFASTWEFVIIPLFSMAKPAIFIVLNFAVFISTLFKW